MQRACSEHEASVQRACNGHFCYSLFWGECAEINMWFLTFLPSLSLSIHFHFWSGFILVPEVGADF